MAVVIPAARTSWNNELFDCCGEPGGVGVCCYVLLCGECAAGDVAAAAGRSYAMSCCIIPLFVPIISPCWFATDRAELAKRYNVNDPYDYNTACCMFMFGCGACLLCQELNHIKAMEQRGLASGGSTIVVLAPQQQAMASAGQPASYQKSA